MMTHTGKTENPIVFMQCPSCRFVWPTREHFLEDPGVGLIRYEASFIDLMAGVFVFRHRCEAPVTMHAGEFADLYDGPIFEGPRTGGGDCPGYCLRKEELRPCPAQCECAYVREVIQIVNNWSKQAAVDDEEVLAPPK